MKLIKCIKYTKSSVLDPNLSYKPLMLENLIARLKSI